MSDVRMVALDSSTKRTGCAFFVNGELDHFALIDISHFNGTVEERIREMGAHIFKLLNEFKPTMVYMEEPKGHSNIDLVRKLSMVLGEVLGWCVEHGAYYEIVKPSEWRSWLGLKQGSKTKREELKQESINAVLDMYGYSVDDDTADAINLGTAVINKFGTQENK